MSEAEIAKEASKIAQTYKLDERLIRRLIRVQVQKNQPSVLYDLDYDLQLNSAIKILKDGNFKNLMKNTKTLRELQENVENSQIASGK